MWNFELFSSPIIEKTVSRIVREWKHSDVNCWLIWLEANEYCFCCNRNLLNRRLKFPYKGTKTVHAISWHLSGKFNLIFCLLPQWDLKQGIFLLDNTVLNFFVGWWLIQHFLKLQMLLDSRNCFYWFSPRPDLTSPISNSSWGLVS